VLCSLSFITYHNAESCSLASDEAKRSRLCRPSIGLVGTSFTLHCVQAYPGYPAKGEVEQVKQTKGPEGSYSP